MKSLAGTAHTCLGAPLSTILLLSPLLFVSSVSAQCHYEATVFMHPDVCTGDKRRTIVPWDIGEDGVIVGQIHYCAPSGDQQGFWWDGEIHIVDTGGFQISGGLEARNADGTMVGWHTSIIDGDGYNGITMIVDGKAIELGLPPGMDNGEATDINDAGQIVAWGNAIDDDYGALGFIWENGQWSSLPGLAGEIDSIWPRSINEHGEIVARHDPDNPDFTFQTIIIRGSEIEYFPLADNVIDSSSPHDLNNLGHFIVLEGHDTWPRMKASPKDGSDVFPAGAYFDGRNLHQFLGYSPGVVETRVRGVNDAGQVVGKRTFDTGDSDAFIWQNDGAIDLETLVDIPGLNLIEARAINNSGQIAARGKLDGKAAGILLTPIDSPPADITRDCRVDHEDLTDLLGQWNSTGPYGDVNEDGAVDVNDLLTLLASWDAE